MRNIDKTLIVYLAGDLTRFKKVYNLYKSFPKKEALILITSFNDDSKLRGEKSLLKEPYDNEIDEEDVLTEYYATTTYTGAIELRKILDHYAFRKVIIVTSSYHLFRTKLIFEKVLKKKNLTFMPVNHKYNKRIIGVEVCKTLLYLLKSYKIYTKNNYHYNQNMYSDMSRLFYKE